MSRFTENLFVEYPELTAPGSGAVVSTSKPPSIVPTNYTLFTTVTNFDSGVVVALNGSIDGTNWSKIIGDQTISGNGTTHYTVSNVAVRYVQPVFVSESGGTAASVLFQLGAS